MTDDRNAPLPWEKGQLRREATEWFVLMRSPEAEQHREAFERWLNSGGLHRAAYNRVANVFGSGKSVDWDALPPARPVRGTVRWTGIVALGVMMLLSFTLWRLFFTPLSTPLPPDGASIADKANTPPVQLVTRMGEIRRLRLPDGSWITLDTDTLVTLEYDHSERELRLEHGRARFEVEHEKRPFVVDAGEGSVTAHGTIFDVSIADDRSVNVALLRGAVDVALPRSLHRPSLFSSTRLAPGQAVRFADADADIFNPIKRVAPPSAIWPSGNIDFPDASLAEVVATANRYSSTKLRLGDLSLATMAVSGTFRIDDPRRLASSLCDLLGLRAVDGREEIVLIKR